MWARYPIFSVRRPFARSRRRRMSPRIVFAGNDVPSPEGARCLEYAVLYFIDLAAASRRQRLQVQSLGLLHGVLEFVTDHFDIVAGRRKPHLYQNKTISESLNDRLCLVEASLGHDDFQVDANIARVAQQLALASERRRPPQHRIQDVLQPGRSRDVWRQLRDL